MGETSKTRDTPGVPRDVCLNFSGDMLAKFAAGRLYLEKMVENPRKITELCRDLYFLMHDGQEAIEKFQTENL
jgi:hypothetical protein